jgi:large subunit ribosomal protein L29
MKAKEIREKSENELKKDLVELRNKKAKMRFDISAKQIKNHREARKVKKNIARILTLLRQAPVDAKAMAGKPVDKQKA